MNHSIEPVQQTIHTDESEDFDVDKNKAAERSTLVSIIVNCCLSLIQIGVGMFSASQGLIAEGIHSLSDLVADFVVLFANRHSQKAPDEDHHYGHLRYENAASLALGLILIFVGVIVFLAAVRKLNDPSLIQTVHTVALWVAGIGVVVKELLFRYMLAEGQRVSSTLLVANAWHARSDAASSFVVLLGVAGNVMGFSLLDPISALIVSGVVAKIGLNFSLQALNDLTDRAADEEVTLAIRQALLSTNGVLGLHALRTRKMGDSITVDVHLEVKGDMTVAEGHSIAVDARQIVMTQYPRVLDVMVHVDPV